MRIEFDLTEHITAEGTTLFIQTEPAFVQAQRSTRGALILCAVAALGGLGGTWYFEGVSDTAGLIAAGGLGVLFSSLWPTTSKARQSAVTALRSRIATDPAYARALGRRVFELRPEGFRVEADHIHAELPWNAVVRTLRTPDWFLMVFVGPSPVPVARESFPTDREYDDFADEAERLIRAGGGTVGPSA